jgi:hypothetical protein
MLRTYDGTMRSDRAREDRPRKRRGHIPRPGYPTTGLALAVVAALLVAGTVSMLFASATGRPALLARHSRASRFSVGGVVSDPIDSKYLTEVPFGASSFWIQPWRAYLDTWPASRLLGSLGINFNVTAVEAPDVARLLRESGFRLARIEVPWGLLSYEDPAKFVDEPSIRQQLVALHEHDLRPLILLNANSGGPAPAKNVTLSTVSAAPVGARTVALTAASAAQVVPGKTGFDKLSFGGDPDILITAIDPSGVAQLSKPLPAELLAGAHPGSTLLYAPFGPPKLTDGAANPAFQATLAGWLGYVATVNHLAESIFGAGGYDLEVWNELSFGSQFLNEENYYSPARESGSGSLTEALLDETVAYVRDPAYGISPQVGISDGFASETPFASGALVPVGTTALSKHLYAAPKDIPSEYVPEPGIKQLNAFGALGSSTNAGKTDQADTPPFIPTYQSDFPEYSLTATQTETVIRDIAPITTTIYGVPHGRNAAPPRGTPPQVWMTEYNLAPAGATIGTGSVPTVLLSPAEQAHLQAKALLRSLVSTVNKGMARDYFFAAAHAGTLSMIDGDFISAVDAHPTIYPSYRLGGETMRGFRNLLAHFRGPGPRSSARQLELLSIAQEGNHAQFTGNGTAAYPPLYDREVLAVLPFQSAPARFVIPVYVMTRNLATLYKPNLPASDMRRYDLPAETFRLTLGDLPITRRPPSVSAYDPLRNLYTPARLVRRKGGQATFELSVTDYPRLLTIDYR